MVATSQTRLGCKLFLLDSNGQTHESTAHLHVESSSEFDLGALAEGLRGLVIRDANGETCLDWLVDGPASPNLPAAEPRAWTRPTVAQDILARAEEATKFELEWCADQPGYEAASHIAMSHQSIRQQDWAGANQHLETALSTNADDVLTWWLKSIVQRFANADASERTELLNAHYLSPMEPALRLESFLSQPVTEGQPANPMLAPIAANPDALLDGVGLLLEAGLPAEASRVIDEALRHRENAMLRYLLAWSLLSETRMAVTAAEHVAKASGLPVEPPFPWRTLEKRAVRELHRQFPTDQRLTDLCQLLDDVEAVE